MQSRRILFCGRSRLRARPRTGAFLDLKTLFHPSKGCFRHSAQMSVGAVGAASTTSSARSAIGARRASWLRRSRGCCGARGDTPSGRRRARSRVALCRLLAAGALDLPRRAREHGRRDEDVDRRVRHALLEELLLDDRLAVLDARVLHGEREIVHERRDGSGFVARAPDAPA